MCAVLKRDYWKGYYLFMLTKSRPKVLLFSRTVPFFPPSTLETGEKSSFVSVYSGSGKVDGRWWMNVQCVADNLI